MSDSTVADLLSLVERTPWLAVDIAGRRFFAPQAPRFAAPERPWPAPVQRGLDLLGVRELYEHQVRAVDLIRAGSHVVVATPTWLPARIR